MTSSEMASPWLDRVAAAAYVGLTVDTLAQMATRGTGPRFSKPTPHIVRYHVDELDRWLRDHEHTSTRQRA